MNLWLLPQWFAFACAIPGHKLLRQSDGEQLEMVSPAGNRLHKAPILHNRSATEVQPQGVPQQGRLATQNNSGLTQSTAAIETGRSTIETPSKEGGLPRVIIDQGFGNPARSNPTVQGFLSGIIWALLVIVAAAFYVREKEFPPKDKIGVEHMPLVYGEWQFSLFGCFDGPALFLLSCCCAPVRWADTMRMARMLTFSGALMLFVGLVVLDVVCAGLSLVVLLGFLVYYRQQIRKKFGIQSGDVFTITQDCLAYTLCSCCAIMQEARQLEEAYQVRHPEICPPRQ